MCRCVFSREVVARMVAEEEYCKWALMEQTSQMQKFLSNLLDPQKHFLSQENF